MKFNFLIRAFIFGLVYAIAFDFVIWALCIYASGGCKVSGNMSAIFIVSTGIAVISGLFFYITQILIKKLCQGKTPFTITVIQAASLLGVGILISFGFFVLTGQISTLFSQNGFWLNSVCAALSVSLLSMIFPNKSN